MSRINWTDDKLLARLLNNKSEKSRWDNISVLRSRPSEELFKKCLELTKSKEQKNRSIGIDVLAQLGLPPRPFLEQTLELYFDLLDIETAPKVLMAILYAIGHNNENLNQKQIEKICSFLERENEWIKEGLVSALLGIDNSKAIETLTKLSSDKLSHVRNWATFGIGTQIEKDTQIIRAALWNRVNDKHQETKLEAIVGLAKRKDNRVIEIIKRELIKGEYSSLLFKAITETGDKQFLPLLQQNLKLTKGDSNINLEWTNDLEDCINELTKLKDGKRTIA